MQLTKWKCEFKSQVCRILQIPDKWIIALIFIHAQFSSHMCAMMKTAFDGKHQAMTLFSEIDFNELQNVTLLLTWFLSKFCTTVISGQCSMKRVHSPTPQQNIAVIAPEVIKLSMERDSMFYHFPRPKSNWCWSFSHIWSDKGDCVENRDEGSESNASIVSRWITEFTISLEIRRC